MYMKWNIFFLHFMAMYSINKKSSAATKFFYQLLRVICLIIFIVTIILCLLDVHFRKDYFFIDVASNFLNCVIFVTCIVRILYFYFYDYKTLDIITSMNTIFRNKSQTGFEEKNTQWHDKLAKNLCLGWTFTAFFTGQFFTILPLLLIRILGKTLPIPAWYPFDWKKNFNYTLTMISQSITQFFMGFAYSNSDMYFMCVMILTTGQFKILAWEFKNIFQTALIKYGLTQSEVKDFDDYYKSTGNKELRKKFQVFTSQKFENALHETLMICIQRHQNLLKFCDLMQDFFNNFLLLDIFFHMLVIVFIAFTMVVAEDFSKCVVLAEYLMTALFDLLLTTYFAQKLSDQSCGLLDVLYETPWYLCNKKKFRSTLIMMQKRTKKFVEVKAGNYMVFNLHLFIMTCKTAASYFAVLRQVTEKE